MKRAPQLVSILVGFLLGLAILVACIIVYDSHKEAPLVRVTTVVPAPTVEEQIASADHDFLHDNDRIYYKYIYAKSRGDEKTLKELRDEYIEVEVYEKTLKVIQEKRSGK